MVAVLAGSGMASLGVPAAAALSPTAEGVPPALLSLPPAVAAVDGPGPHFAYRVTGQATPTATPGVGSVFNAVVTSVSGTSVTLAPIGTGPCPQTLNCVQLTETAGGFTVGGTIA